MAAPVDPVRARLTVLLDGVRGFLYDDEAWALCRRSTIAATAALEVGRHPVIVEIGSHCGRSTICQALGVQVAGGGVVHAIDPYLPTADGSDRGAISAELRSNVSRAGLSEYVRLVPLTSHQARASFDSQIDALFVDGAHDVASVTQDIEDWVPLVREGGSIAFNDPSWPGVYAALRARVLLTGSDLRRPALIDNTVFFTVQGSRPWGVVDAARLRRALLVLSLRKVLTPIRRHVPDSLARLGRRAIARLASSPESP